MSKREDVAAGAGRPRFAGLLARVFVPALCAALLLPLGIVRIAHSQADEKTKVAFIGDSTADGWWGGVSRLVPRDGCLKGIELGRFAKNSTGLTRPERFNWAEEAKRIGESFKPHLFVMSLGLNDRQSVVIGGKVTLDNSPDYPARYKERVAAVLNAVAESKAALLWVGLPAMREAVSDRHARDKNKLFAEAIAEFGVENIQFVPPWRLNGTDEDKFASYGPDQTGKIIQIRASDGEHFTPAGELLVAAYLLPKISASLAKSGAKLGEACAS